MTTRTANSEDVPSLLRLINRAYRVEDFFVRGDRTNDADLRARMAKPGACFLVVDGDDGQLAGSVYVELRGARGYFALLAVDPARQRVGLGRRLVAAVEAHCRAAGCSDLDLDVVNLRHELPSFYSALGFALCGSAPFPDPQRLVLDAELLLMTKPLPAAAGDPETEGERR